MEEGSTSYNSTKRPQLMPDQRWETHKEEIYQFYIIESRTLAETMSVMEVKHNIKAWWGLSPRLNPLVYEKH